MLASFIPRKDKNHSCSARAKRTLFLTKSARTLTHYYANALYVFLGFSLFHSCVLKLNLKYSNTYIGDV